MGRIKWIKSHLKEWQITIIELIAVAVTTALFFTYIIPWGRVTSESMYPTLDKNDYVIANGLAYVKNEPQRGDVIIFDGTVAGTEDEYVIKRVIGVPGDEIMFFDGYVYINGQLCYEEYLDADVETNSFYDYEVPAGCYFVMGDNRENSFDSRYWIDPYVKKEDIKGKMIVSVPVSKLFSYIQNQKVE